MNTLPSGNGGSSQSRDNYQYGPSNTRTDNNNTSIGIQGDSNQIIGNVFGSHNKTINNTTTNNTSNTINNITNVRVSEESARIQAWLSPLEPHAKHQDVRNRRLDGVGDWVLQKNEFESWCKSEDGTGNRTLLCYGDQGVGKTYIRYTGIFQRV